MRVWGALSPTPARTSSTMSPFSACTWAMAPRSRMMLKISYIWEERCAGRVGLRLCQQQPQRLLLTLAPALTWLSVH